MTYFCFFGIGIVLYAASPTLAHAGSKALFVAAFCVILSMYGGGFATVPAYLADIFGTRFVGAIHGRLLTAWSTAGVVGPFVIGYIRDAQISAGVERALVYDRTLYILSAFLVVGFICNALDPPGRAEMVDEGDRRRRRKCARRTTARDLSFGIGLGGMPGPLGWLAWLAVGLPALWGAWQTLQSAVKIFG